MSKLNSNGILTVNSIDGCPVIIDIMSGTTKECLSSRPMSPKHKVIHNTGNQNSNATDTSNNNFMKNDDYVLWHFTVDDDSITQGWSVFKTGFHTGDGRNGEGNSFGIGIEIVDSKNVLKAIENAYKLMKVLDEEIKELDTTKHEDYSGKHCPAWILDNIGWDKFISGYYDYIAENEQHWAQSSFDFLNEIGIDITQTRFDDYATRGETMAIAERLYKKIVELLERS